MLEQIKDTEEKRSVLRGAIEATPPQGVDSLSETITELKRQYPDGETDEIEI
ncbi:hypothetical protein ACN22W_22265 [Burkholderia theae]|uniref:hypothetical protein n=1 Tax=Burkholderia theae TaxID=3143496 RepID=UPI003AFAFB7E